METFRFGSILGLSDSEVSTLLLASFDAIAKLWENLEIVLIKKGRLKSIDLHMHPSVANNFNRFLCFLASCVIKHSINKSINDMIATLYVGKMSWKLILDIDYHFVAMKKKIINHGSIPITASIYERGP